MLTDAQLEAPAARRLAAFGATFLGLITLTNANYVGDVPQLAPPLVALIVVLAAVGGLLIWVNTRYSRAVFWVAAGFALFSAAGAAIVVGPPAWLAASLALLGVSAFVSAGLVAAGLFKTRMAKAAAKARYVVIISGLLLVLAAAPVGPGPVLALVAAGALLAIVALLRPADPEQQV